MRHRSDARINHYDTVIGKRSNYHILVNTTVGRVLFEGTTAVGVEYQPTTGGNKSCARASKEVILAAGALHTPQILQLSGIGPKTLLGSLDIEVISDLPGVGQNFQDQPVIYISYNCQSVTTPTTYFGQFWLINDVRSQQQYKAELE